METNNSDTINFNCLTLDMDNYMRHLIFVINELFSLQFQIPNLLLALIVIKYKRSEDILEGINKLDYLLKVSVFQIYKDKNLEK